jgi:hypothetical protein
MWLPGHFAVAFLICLPLVYYAKEYRVLAIAYVAIFSQLPDLIHLGSLRILSHSPIGLIIMLAVVLALLWMIFRPRTLLLVIGALAAMAHLLADLYIGSIFPYYPFNTKYLEFHELNSTFDLTAEVGLIVLVIVLTLIALRPWEMMRSIGTYSKPMRRNLLLLIVPFGLLSMAEGALFFLTTFRNQTGALSGLLLLSFLLLFMVSATITLAVVLKAPSEPDEADRQALKHST